MKTTHAARIIALLVAPTLSFAQLSWNPAADGYSTQGGNGDWSDADAWWNGAANVTVTSDPGAPVMYEGAGDVGGSTFQPQRLEFENLIGDYNINHNLELRLSGTHAVHVKDGNTDLYLQSLGYTAGTGSNRSVRNDGTGTVTINSVLRRFGGGTTNLALQGNGHFQINGVGAMGGQLIKNGTGDLVVSGNMNNFSNGIVLNAGTMWMDNTGASMTWNDGTILQNLDEGTFTTNVINLSSALNKGTGTDFVFDFSGFNATAQGSYTLMNFASTDFTSSDFTASNITYDSGLSGQFDATGTTLEFTVIPEPGTLALVGIALGTLLLTLRRRR